MRRNSFVERSCRFCAASKGERRASRFPSEEEILCRRSRKRFERSNERKEGTRAHSTPPQPLPAFISFTSFSSSTLHSSPAQREWFLPPCIRIPLFEGVRRGERRSERREGRTEGEEKTSSLIVFLVGGTTARCIFFR